MKTRLLAIIIILVSLGLIYYNWHQLQQDGTYSLKLAAFGPVLTIGGIFMLIAPARAGKPTTGKDKLIVLLVFAIGLLAGLVNWYPLLAVIRWSTLRCDHRLHPLPFPPLPNYLGNG